MTVMVLHPVCVGVTERGVKIKEFVLGFDVCVRGVVVMMTKREVYVY
jgi:hypothetical protein